MNKKFLLLGFCILLLFIPKVNGDCEYRKLKETIYMSPDDWVLRCIYIYDSEEDPRQSFIIQWSFRTYNSSFTVTISTVDFGTISEGKTSDHGEIDRNRNDEFGFRNTDIVGGYIEIDIHVKEEETIDGYNSTVFLFILISMISVISIKKKVLKGRY